MNLGGLFGRSAGQAVGNATIPGTTPLQRQRIKQIESLSTFNQNVLEVERDKEYRVNFKIASNSLCLHIVFPAQFPNEKPIVRVSPQVQHSWVDEQMIVVGCSSLNSFYMHSNLGKVIQLIVQEFKDHPPYIYMQPAIGHTTEQGMGTFHGHSSNLTAIYSPPTSSQPVTGQLISTEPDDQLSRITSVSKRTGGSDVDQVMEELSKLSKGELEDISGNPDILLDYIDDMKSIKDLQDKRKKLVEENKLIAETNISKEPNVEESKQKLRESYDNFLNLHKKFHAQSVKQEEYLQMFDVNHIVTNLKIAILEAEESSEECAEEFLNAWASEESKGGKTKISKSNLLKHETMDDQAKSRERESQSARHCQE